MVCVVFLRGVNVGGARTFQPSALVKELAKWDVVNIGAAGTFVIRKGVANEAVRDEVRRRLPFEADLMLCRGGDLIRLADGGPLTGQQLDQEVRPFVSILEKRPRAIPELPLHQPDGNAWQVKMIAVPGRFAVSLWRRTGKRLLYPNEVVEKRLGVRATTRTWDTLLAICDVLKRSE